MAGKCELCGGRIVNGRCTDCGMDYSRMKNRYHLNENCSDYDLNARDINTGYESSLKSKGETSEGKQREKTILNGKASAKPNVSRPQKKTANMHERQKQKSVSWEQVARKTTATVKEKNTKSGKTIAILVTLFCFLLGSFGGVIEEIFDGHSDNYEPVYSEAEEDIESSRSDLPELTEDGASVDFDLCQYANYVVGVDIPEGTYVISNTDGEYSATVVTDNKQYNIHERYYIETGGYEEDVQLYDGTVLWVNTQGTVNCMSDNAKAEDMHPWDGDTGASEMTIPAQEDKEDTYTVGTDIDSGRYTMTYVGDGTSVIGVDVTSAYGGTEYISLANAAYSETQSEYKGIVLTEGMEIVVERYGDDDAAVKFSPMGTEDTVDVENNEFTYR